MSVEKYRISAKGLFINKNNELLLVKGKSLYNGKEFWCAPGGGVEEGENIYVACERELKEETGYSGKAQKIVFMQDIEFPNSGRSVEIFVFGKIIESEPPLPNHDHEFKFISRENFNQILFLPKGIDPFTIIEENKADYQTYL